MDERLKNKKWRINNLYKIINKDGEKITFRPNKAQQHFEENRADRNIILKSRQIGFTTYEAIDMLDDSLFLANQQNLFIAHTKEDATEIFGKKIVFAWQNINEELKKLWKSETDSTSKLKFGFGEGDFSTLMVSNSGRSSTNSRVHISELAKLCIKFPLRGNEIVTGTFPSVPAGKRLDIEGTAEGMSGHFADIFWDAWKHPIIAHSKQFKAHFYNWTWDEEDINRVVKRVLSFEEMENGEVFRKYAELHGLNQKQITYYYHCWIASNKDWNTLHQEYPTTPEEAFILSGTPYFDNQKIIEYIQRCPLPIAIGSIFLDGGTPVFTNHPNGEIKIWEYPQEYKSYVIGGDTAEGLEDGDYSVLVVIDNQSGKTVAKYSAHVRPDELVNVAHALGLWYNNAYMGIEVNKDGLWVNTELFKNGYPNLYFREAIDDITNRVSAKVGFRTDERTRPFILSQLQKMLYNNPDIWTNKDFLDECLTFVRNKVGRPEAMSGKHDDEIMATAIAHEIRRNAPQAFNKLEVKSNSEAVILARLEALYGKKGKHVVSQNDFL